MATAEATIGIPRRSTLRELASGIGTIMTKELRSRMRGRRAFVVLTVYLSILALLTYGVYTIIAPSARGMGADGLANANASALIGQAIFASLSIFQLILVCFIAPAFTAGQVSLEREKQTLDLLVSTPLRPASIVLGKLGAALAFVVLMIVAALPIVAIVLMYGGVTVADLARQQLVLLSTALALGAIGLFYSALLKRTQAATVLTYITMLALTLGTVLIFIFWTVVASRADDAGFGPPRVAPEQLLYVNPGIAMLDVIAPAEPGGAEGIARTLAQLRGSTIVFEGAAPPCIGNECPVGDGFANDVAGELTGYWWTRIAFTYLLIAAVLTYFATRLVVPAGMRWAFRRRHRGAGPAEPGTQPGHATPAGGPTIEELDR